MFQMFQRMFQDIGLLHDPQMGDQVPEIQVQIPDPVAKKPKAKITQEDVWQPRTTETGAAYFQKAEKDTSGAVYSYDIRASQPKGGTGRVATLTPMDREIIMGKIKSPNWTTAQRVKQVWASMDGSPDSKTVKELSSEMSERTVRNYTRCFNASLSQSGEGQKASPLQMSAKVA